MPRFSRNAHFAAPLNLPTTGSEDLLLAGDDLGDLSVATQRRALGARAAPPRRGA